MLTTPSRAVARSLLTLAKKEEPPSVAADRGHGLASDLERINATTPIAERWGYTATAHYIGVPVGTVRAWVSRRRIPHLRLGARLVVFERAEIDRWLASQRVAAEAAK